MNQSTIIMKGRSTEDGTTVMVSLNKYEEELNTYYKVIVVKDGQVIEETSEVSLETDGMYYFNKFHVIFLGKEYIPEK